MYEIKNINKEDFTKNTLNIEGFAIVECYNKLSGALQIMEPIFIKLRKKFQKSIVHLRINTDDNPIIIEKFYLIKQTSYLFFYNGELIDRIDSMIPFSEFSDILEKHIKLLKTD